MQLKQQRSVKAVNEAGSNLFCLRFFNDIFFTGISTEIINILRLKKNQIFTHRLFKGHLKVD